MTTKEILLIEIDYLAEQYPTSRVAEKIMQELMTTCLRLEQQ